MSEEPHPSTEYIRDLLERLDCNEALPGLEKVKSSKDTVSWHAHKEAAEELNNPALAPVIREYVRKAKKVRDFQKLNILLCGLIRNTHHPDALNTFECLMEQAPKSDNVWMYLLEGARHVKFEPAMPYALRIIEEPNKGGLALTAAIEYLGTMGGVKAIPVIGQLLDNDCYGKCPPMYCAFAFAEIEHADALPYLNRAIERHAKSQKRDSTDVYSYSCHAVERIKTAPPMTLNEMHVCSWTVPPDVPERIALCSCEQGVATASCDASWKILDVHHTSSREEAQSKGIELAGTKNLHWHQRPFSV